MCVRMFVRMCVHVRFHHLAGTSWPSVPTVGDSVTLASGTLAPKGDATLVVGDGVSATLQAAAEHDVPVAHAAVPATVSTCSDTLLLNGSPSTTTSVFPLSYQWEVSAYTCMHMHMRMHMHIHVTCTCACTCACTCTCP